jgi:hypothetical protein
MTSFLVCGAVVCVCWLAWLGFAGRKLTRDAHHAHEVLIAKGWYTHARDIERWLADMDYVALDHALQQLRAQGVIR